ncbi:hypothetical protein [Tumebacillus flagellatus]|uniref:hypothetical protein n=1 Tax=Tumebacillus flagellatus TaxID=1157490 RepID=UPI0013788155|nr:hypothetical protein [Tumebacillus flagellatus]
MNKALKQKIEKAKKLAEELREAGYQNVSVDEETGEISMNPKKEGKSDDHTATA